MALEQHEPEHTLDAARDELKSETVTAPPHLLGGVMDTVRREGRSRRVLDVPDAASSRTQVREGAAVKILRLAADQVPGLRVGRCQIGEATPQGYAVRLTARAALGAPIPELAEAARRAVHRAASRQLGWTVTRVDIDIADLDQ